MHSWGSYFVHVPYDKTGKVEVIVSNRNSIKIDRDEKERPSQLTTNWGLHQENKYKTDSNDLENIRFSLGDYESTIMFNKGRPTSIKQFDQGEYKIGYYDTEKHACRIKRIKTPNDVELQYKYDDTGLLSAVDCDGMYHMKYNYDDQGRLKRFEMGKIF